METKEIEQLNKIISNILKEAELVSQELGDDERLKQLNVLSRSYIQFANKRDKLLVANFLKDLRYFFLISLYNR
jgi:hypothetical protein